MCFNILLIKIVVKFSVIFSDKLYLKILYRLITRQRLNLKNPTTFSEKLNWLKINDRKQLYTKMVDKYQAKLYATHLIGEEYVVPCYGVYNNFHDINFDILPEKFVVKTTHDSSGAYIVKDKSLLDKGELEIRLNKLIKCNHYSLYREYPYKDVQPRIIIEQLLSDKNENVLKDYKFLCFHGVPKLLYVTNKGGEVFENFYDMNFNSLDISHGYPKRAPEYEIPANFDRMKELASKLSAGIPFIRIDFFNLSGKIYINEFTFYDWGGFKPFTEQKWELLLGSYINLELVDMKEPKHSSRGNRF